MKPDTLIDFANQSTMEVAKFKVPFILSPNKLMAAEYVVPSLTWDSVKFGKSELRKIPSNKRGIYAFVVCQNDTVLPMHGYVLYIGIAGRDSRRPLRDRYRDYLNQKKVMKRHRIAQMIGTWHQVLRFYFAPVDEVISNEDLKTLEKQLNSALLPPYSEGDLDADIKPKRRAFRL